MNTAKSILPVLAVLAFGTLAARADIAYLSPQYLGNLYGNNQIGFSACCGDEPGGVITGPFAVGNTIKLTTVAPLQSVDLFGYAGGGSLPIQLNLYAGSDPNTGTLLGSETVTPTGNGWTTEVFNFGGLVVPQTLTFIVSIVGNHGSYDDSFVNWQQFTGVTGAPTIGTRGDMWYGAPSSYIADNNYAIDTGAQTNTLAAQFNVPDGGMTIMLLGGALLGLETLRRRFRV